MPDDVVPRRRAVLADVARLGETDVEEDPSLRQASRCCRREAIER